MFASICFVLCCCAALPCIKVEYCFVVCFSQQLPLHPDLLLNQARLEVSNSIQEHFSKLIPFSMKILKGLILLLTCAAMSQSALAQTIKGYVYDLQSRQALENVS